jgi:putative endonuclease
MYWLARLRAWWRSRHVPLPLGQRGEQAAAAFLRRLGYKIVAHGARDRIGELDLVAVDGRTIVFVEVKTRTTHDAGHPVEAIDAQKQLRLTRVAATFLKRHDLLECPARFDVIAITWPDAARKPLIQHFPHAFDAVGKGQMFT